MHLIVLPVVVLGSLSKQQKRSYRRWGGHFNSYGSQKKYYNVHTSY